MSFIKEKNASLFIMLNALMWGSSYIWSKILLNYLPYFTILFFYSLGGLLILTAVFFRRLRSIDRKTILAGIGIGMFSIFSNISCMLALGNTSSSNTAFIVQMSVILTPMIMAAAERKLPGRKFVLGSLTAVLGLLLLTLDFDSFSFDPGDIFALANALFFSLYLASQKLFASKTDPAQFTFIQHITSAAVFFAAAFFLERGKASIGDMNGISISVLVLSIFISVSTILIQSSALKFIRPEKATVIYTLEPVSAAVFAYIFIGERMEGFNAYLGCALIITAILLSVKAKGSAQGISKQPSFHIPAQPQKSMSTSLRRHPSEALDIGLHSGGSSSL